LDINISEGIILLTNLTPRCLGLIRELYSQKLCATIQNMNKNILVVFTTALTFIVNSLAGATTWIGGVDTKYISDMNPTSFTPKPYVFSIWGVIYLGILAYNIYLFQNSPSEKQKDRVILSNILNIAWIFAWQYGYIHLALLLIVGLLVTLLSVVYENFEIKMDLSSKVYWLRRIPFEIYGAWICVATIANSAISIKSILNSGTKIVCIKAPCVPAVTLLGLNEMTWAYIMIAVAVLLGLYMTVKYKAWPFIIVVAWAVYGILF